MGNQSAVVVIHGGTPRERRRQVQESFENDPEVLVLQRITFHKEHLRVEGKPHGHPLLDSVLDLILEQHREFLRQRAVLVDSNDMGTEPRVLFYLEHIALVLCGNDGEANEWSADDLKALHTSGEIHQHQSRCILKETGS